STSSGEDSEQREEKFMFCNCAACRDRRKLMITKDTVYKVEFKLHEIVANEGKFRSELTERCRQNAVEGYIVFNKSRSDATGIMEGAIRNINKVKNWIEKECVYIAEPRKSNTFFSWYMIATRPTGLQFDEHRKTPHEKRGSGASTSSSSS
ncbi:hypothetical protein KR222_003818, partial [Zaprionus bogoriensis]